MTQSTANARVKLLSLGIGLAGTLLLFAWLLGYFEGDDQMSDDPAVADLQRAMQEGGKADIAVLKRKYSQLTPEQQREFGKRKMLMSLPQQEQKLRDFFAQPEVAQRKQIDREIDAMEDKRQQTGGNAGSKGRGPGQVGGGTKPNGDGGGGGNPDPQRIMELKQAWTANASPELRSMMDRRIRLLNERREERGLGPL